MHIGWFHISWIALAFVGLNVIVGTVREIRRSRRATREAHHRALYEYRAGKKAAND